MERLEDVKARVAEFSAAAGPGEALKAIERVADALGERLRKANGLREVNTVLKEALEGVYSARLRFVRTGEFRGVAGIRILWRLFPRARGRALAR